jgi:hypothetical protein
MSNWVDKWSVQSEVDPTKYYTVSRAEDGSFGCSCPAWIFRKTRCKHIEGVARTIEGLEQSETSIINRLRFISKMHHMKLSCENCKHSTMKWGKMGCSLNNGSGVMKDLVFAKGDKKTFYILGRCCIRYEKA